MDDLSLHILDIAENSIRAEARTIRISIVRAIETDRLIIEIADDGRGMDKEVLARVRDPFYTTKNKKTGLGIPLLAQAAEQACGHLTVESAPGQGTKVSAIFQWGHIDRPALGRITETILMLIAGHPERDFLYEEREGDREFRFDTREIKKDLDDVPINAPLVLDAIRGLLNDQAKFEREDFKLQRGYP